MAPAMFEHIPATSGIYAIVNKINDHRYVGQAKNMRTRVQSHWRDLRKGVHRTSAACHLQNAWNQWGEENFIVEVLETVSDNSGQQNYHVRPDNLSLAEHFYINERSEFNSDKRIVRNAFHHLIELKAWRD